ncbi:hypothetical protein [Nocardia aurantia]|uniref:Uncharacterized protein n=1 Tax=Nocardia aurantia TaxID=2585199 RepID=A0A7K0DRV7_9NOCA|nr:hypothetical protein [Nocardia aurantia]MQY28338.1 hypothetical protein [Nocardia aurantia]
MNGIANIARAGINSGTPEMTFVSVSRGVLALQGTGLSIASVFGAEMQAPKHVIKTDKHAWGWHPVAAKAAIEAYGADQPVGAPAARLRNASPPVTVISRRRRSRQR